MGLLDVFKYKTFIEKYVAGFPNIKGPKDIKIIFKEEVIEIVTIDIFFKKKITLRPENVIEVSLDQQSYRHAGKTAAGAIIGGILTGGIGLIAGAALGGKRRTENKLVLTINTGSRDFDIFINPSRTTVKLYSEFIDFINKYEKPYIEVKDQEKLPQQTIPLQLADTANSTMLANVAEQLEKLHSLVEKGILTKEEFENQKRKIIQGSDYGQTEY